MTSDAIGCDIDNVDKILFHPMNACFLGLEFIAGMGSASLKEKLGFFFFGRCIIVKLENIDNDTVIYWQ